ncbi:Arabinan endo-1,5-alpha-L-arabinosidase [Termitomyces sp. T112]|nr:Arabinan endo-1,5-alpha-L-arabinosidase [Termitomyces sp. T112]
MVSFSLLSVILSIFPLLRDVGGLSAPNITKRDTVKGPVISVNFPDPSIIWVPSENSWFAFATNGNGVNVQLATSLDFDTWSVTKQDALPTVGAWVDQANPAVWAPMPDGSFVLYYAATSAQDPTAHCVGVATSANVRGPYTPLADPFVCHLDLGGAIDPAGHHHPDGSLYVVYKIDGNNRGNGGSCNNGVAPIKSTPIMLQKVAADGYTKIGSEVQILDRDDGDGPLIEAPSLIQVKGVWFLFFSSGCFAETTYDLSYAYATNVTGPYTKARGPIAPLLVSGEDELKAPGSACAVMDGSKLAFHAWLGNDINGGRGMWTAIPSIDGTTITL